MDDFHSLLADILHDCGLECIPSDKISALARICGPSEVANLIDELDGLRDTDIADEPDDVKDEYWRRRMALSQILAQVGQLAVIPLLHALSSANPQTYSYAARALGLMRAVPAFEPIADLLLRERDYMVKIGLIEALGDLGNERVIDVLLPFLHVPEQQNRGWTIRLVANALGKIGTERVIQPLVDVLESDPNWFARLGAVEGLRKLRDDRAEAGLRTALADADARVRQEAAAALRDLANKQT
jgi:HEAT repeat protein